MLRGCRGVRVMSPSRSKVFTMLSTSGGVTPKKRCMSASAREAAP